VVRTDGDDGAAAHEAIDSSECVGDFRKFRHHRGTGSDRSGWASSSFLGASVLFG
jgi:hypothetical protein